jgi:hypothetical protein
MPSALRRVILVGEWLGTPLFLLAVGLLIMRFLGMWGTEDVGWGLVLLPLWAAWFVFPPHVAMRFGFEDRLRLSQTLYYLTIGFVAAKISNFSPFAHMPWILALSPLWAGWTLTQSANLDLACRRHEYFPRAVLALAASGVLSAEALHGGLRVPETECLWGVAPLLTWGLCVALVTLTRGADGLVLRVPWLLFIGGIALVTSAAIEARSVGGSPMLTALPLLAFACYQVVEDTDARVGTRYGYAGLAALVVSGVGVAAVLSGTLPGVELDLVLLAVPLYAVYLLVKVRPQARLLHASWESRNQRAATGDLQRAWLRKADYLPTGPPERAESYGLLRVVLGALGGAFVFFVAAWGVLVLTGWLIPRVPQVASYIAFALLTTVGGPALSAVLRFAFFRTRRLRLTHVVVVCLAWLGGLGAGIACTLPGSDLGGIAAALAEHPMLALFVLVCLAGPLLGLVASSPEATHEG